MLFGLDIDFPSLSLARANAKHSSLVQGHALVLPYADASFDVSFFHFVLFWVAEPVLALAEARRVTRPGGAIIAFAEPDYSQRKTDSPSLVRLNDVQISSLRAQGANPFLGSRLGELFSKTGIQIEEFGQLDPFVDAPTTEEAEMELKVIQKDIEPLLSQEEANQLISDLRQTGETAWLQVPTYFCWGFV